MRIALPGLRAGPVTIPALSLHSVLLNALLCAFAALMISSAAASAETALSLAEKEPTQQSQQVDPRIAQALAEESAADLLRRVDEIYRADSSEAQIRMQIVTPNWERTMEMHVWARGMDDTFIRVLAPKKDRGIATLKLGDEMWNYFPKIDKVIKVPPSMMMSSWMGSDFTNDDLVKESSLADDYDIVREDTETTVSLTLTPKEETVTVWAKIHVVVDRTTLMPIEQSYFNERGEKVRIMTFHDPRDYEGRMLPSRVVMTPLTENKKGNRTVIYYDELKLNVELDEEIFTWRNLKSRFN